MNKINITLPKYRLFLQFRLIKRRKSPLAEPLIPTPKMVRTKYRRGTYVGRFFRHIFGHRKIGKVLAGGMSLIVILASYFPPSNTIQAQDTDEPVITTEVNLATEKSIQYPLDNVAVTQGFGFFHPGVDLDGITGDAVKPIKPGKVINISYSKFAYGNSVLIEHANGISSLYAHLSKIEVQPGQQITMDTEIGQVGTSGRAFGDHLHLEVYDHGRAVNPLDILR